jgi:hypothetical protein
VFPTSQGISKPVENADTGVLPELKEEVKKRADTLVTPLAFGIKNGTKNNNGLLWDQLADHR